MRWKIGKFEFDGLTGRLRQTEERRLARNDSRVLKFLIENFGGNYTNDKIVEAVWQEAVEDDGLYKSIQNLRTAFGGDREAYIISRPYQLVVKPERIPDEDLARNQTVVSDDPSASQENKILQERLPTALLKLYYPDSDLRAQNLFRYSYSVDGREITTNIVTSDSWLGLVTPISERAFRSFPLSKPFVPLPPISEFGTATTRTGVAEKRYSVP